MKRGLDNEWLFTRPAYQPRKGLADEFLSWLTPEIRMALVKRHVGGWKNIARDRAKDYRETSEHFKREGFGDDLVARFAEMADDSEDALRICNRLAAKIDAFPLPADVLEYDPTK